MIVSSRYWALLGVVLAVFCNEALAFTAHRKQFSSDVSESMVPPLKEDEITSFHEEVTAKEVPVSKILESSRNNDVQVSFSHIQLYTDQVADINEYKKLEDFLNKFSRMASSEDKSKNREIWQKLNPGANLNLPFVSQNRDVVKQLLVGFGFRVTGYRIPKEGCRTNTRSVLVTSKDPHGVQIVVTSVDSEADQESDEFFHFDAANVRRFYSHHTNRQGIAVLGFRVDGIETVYSRYKVNHPTLIHSFKEYGNVRVLEVFAYYNHDDEASETEKKPDVGTLLRFIESGSFAFCDLPGLEPLSTTFDDSSQPAYCDHWVSNVFSRTEFLNTLEDTLGFTPKVDFNAGVVAAGEAQIESTVTGNDSIFRAEDKISILRDQSQVYLPINNALSEVGHVHGFLKEIGQGIQHVASRVENLVEFIQRCNDIREATGEGFTFLRIPRSYYGVLTANQLVESVGITLGFSELILATLEQNQMIAVDGAVNLDLDKESIASILDVAITARYRDIYESKKNEILNAVLKSRYRNLYSLLRDNISEDTYLGLVRNQILCDVQGEDILYQIFTSNILQRNPGEEAPFFEYIQRVCSECKDENGCTVQIKPGCGGFGIRNFLTLFLSIEVSKAMLEVSEAKLRGDEHMRILAQKKVDCFTNQLNDSNPILTQISDAMTLEGFCKEQMESALIHGDEETALTWKKKMEEASETKADGNRKLMDCSARYQALMRQIREDAKASD